MLRGGYIYVISLALMITLPFSSLIRYPMLRPSSLRVSRLPLHPLAPDANEYCLLLSIAFDALDDPVNGAQDHLIIEIW